MSRTTAAAGTAALASLVFVGGCAGNQPVPVASIEQAEQRLEEAERADAQRYANRELNMARDKLLQAREAREEGNDESAARLAEQAELDAALAIAAADNQVAQDALDELQETLATLESELQRQQGDRPGALPADDEIGVDDGDIDVSLRDDDIGVSPSAEPGNADPLEPVPQPDSQDDPEPELDPGL